MFTVNLFTPVWLALAGWLAYTDRVSWWVIVLIVLQSVKIKATFGKKSGLDKARRSAILPK